MKVELHLHTSRLSPCSVRPPEVMLAEVARTGYQAVFLTEHDMLWPEEDLAPLREQFPSLLILPGVELSFFDAVQSIHLLVLGTNDDAFLQCTEPAEVIARARHNNLPTILAHPYRWEGASTLLAEKPPLPDAIELHTPNHPETMALMSAATARQKNLRLVNSGDVHRLDMINRSWIETDAPFTNAHELRLALLQGAYQNVRMKNGRPLATSPDQSTG